MKRKLFITLFLILASIIAHTQTPDMYPPPVPEPFELTLFNILLYMVAPILLIVFYIFYRRKKRKERKK